jgi:Sulfotransferase domain
MPCYHMADVIDKVQADFWIRVSNGEKVNFDEVFNAPNSIYEATCDYPSSLYWKEQLEAYPDAKVVLSVRDPDKWYESCLKTIFQMVPDSPHTNIGIRIMMMELGLPSKNVGQMINKCISQDLFKGDWSKENVIRRYIEHNERVKREVPPDKLLLHNSEVRHNLCIK